MDKCLTEVVLTGKESLIELFARFSTVMRLVCDSTEFSSRNDHPLCEQMAQACEFRIAAHDYSAAHQQCMDRQDEKLYRDALFVQSACNLSGVVFSLDRVVRELRREWEDLGAPGEFGAYCEMHPVSRLYVEQMVYLALGRPVLSARDRGLNETRLA